MSNMDRSIWATPAEEDKVDKSSTSVHPSQSALSGGAVDFTPIPSEPPPDVSTADAFAQLDDASTAEESMRIRSDDDLFSDDFTPAAHPVVEQTPVQEQVLEPAEPTRGRGRGRGRNRDPREGRDTQRRGDNGPPSSQSGQAQKVPSDAPTGPRKEGVQSVRGDRRATGGVKKPKLSEDELAEKMAQIQIKNASLTAAHARAEADAASFAEREQQAKIVAEQRKKEERRDRQQMMGEREKNRQRKLKAMEGREWDAEKNDDDYGKGGRFDKAGGFSGDKADYSDGREYLYREPARGGRGQRSSARARGGNSRAQAVPTNEDFPSLPSGPTSTVRTDDAPSGKSWADQVEAG